MQVGVDEARQQGAAGQVDLFRRSAYFARLRARRIQVADEGDAVACGEQRLRAGRAVGHGDDRAAVKQK